MHRSLILVFLTGNMALLFAGCKKNENEDDSIAQYVSSEITQVANKPTKEATAPYEVLRQWLPNNEPTGYGAEILLNLDYTESELISFVKQLAASHDPVIIRIFTSLTAYEQEKTENYGPSYDSDYILFYVKNMTGRGAYRGFNEIRWMQAVGKYSSKFGLKTKM